MRALLALLALLALPGALAGCTDWPSTVSCKVADNDILPAIPPGAPATRFYPLVVGARWTYRYTNAQETTTQTVTVDDIAPVGAGDQPDLPAFEVVTHLAYGAEVHAWIEDRGQQIVSHRELSIDAHGASYGDELFEPGRPFVDESTKHLDAGSDWKTSFADIITDSGGTYADCKADHWEIQNADDTVTVPAGTFHALRVHRTDSGATMWYARGVGLVKRTTDTNHSELTDFSPP